MNPLLFSPTSIGNLVLKNRIVIPPMCQYSAEHGLATDWHLVHYGSLSHSGAGLLIIEATAVTPEGRISPFDLGIWSDETEESLARLRARIRNYSSVPVCLQLAHAGRKASHFPPWIRDGVVPAAQGGWQPEAPSALAYERHDGGAVTPQALDEAGCLRVKKAFAEAAARAARAGFDAVELHAAHGYLLHEFLSPLSNARADGYGGSLEKRMRYPLEVFDAVRAAFPPEKPVGVRISGSDWVEGGWDVHESRAFSLELQKRGSAYIHVSGGGLSPRQQVKARPGYQVDMAATVRGALRAAAESFGQQSPAQVIAVGLITEPEQAENIIVSGQADLVAVGRGMLYDPRWPWHAAAKLGASVASPPQYWRAAPSGHEALFEKETG